MVQLVLVGGGKMGESLLVGLLGSNVVQLADVVVVEAVPARRDELVTRFPGLVCPPAYDGGAEGAVIAVKPADVEAACATLSGVERVLSIAAGVPVRSLERWLGPGARVIRAMPNTPAMVGAGTAAIAAGSSATDEDLAWAERILGAVGTVHRLPEALLDAVTGLSGSGPAYVFLVAEALIDAGVRVGLSPAVSAALVRQTLLGAARLLVESGEEPARLREAVTSPGGTTAAGLRVLEERAVRGAFVDAVAAARARSIELGSE